MHDRGESRVGEIQVVPGKKDRVSIQMIQMMRPHTRELMKFLGQV